MTPAFKPYAKLVAAIVIVLVVAGCASQPSLTPGTYTSTITREDSTSYGFIGDWELTLTEENGFSGHLIDANPSPNTSSINADFRGAKWINTLPILSAGLRVLKGEGKIAEPRDRRRLLVESGFA